MEDSITIAIDAMGGDNAPKAVVDGVVQAAEISKNVKFLLIGREEEISKYKLPVSVNIVDARDIIDCNEPPVQALMTKKDSSIMRGIKLVQSKEASAFVSAGSTGAIVAASIFKLGLLEGIKKCGILVPFPTANGMCYLIDVGANLNPKPINFLHYAIMGTCYIKIVSPELQTKIGLLNIGEEDVKGTEVTKEAYKLCKDVLPNFAGNAEGHDILSGKFQLILCDGFVGNIVLKLGESIPSFVNNFLGNSAKDNDKYSSWLRVFDFTEYGGAPVLGVNGTVLISHGRSNDKAIKNAILNGINLVHHKINERISEEIKQHSLWKRLQKMFTSNE